MTKDFARPIRTLLVTDFPVTGWGLARLIESRQPRLFYAGMAATRAEALAALTSAEPDVVLIDIDGELGPDLIREMLSQARLKVLVLTGCRDITVHDRAVLAGATGLTSKTGPVEVLLWAIERVHEGEVWIDHGSVSRIFHELTHRSDPQEDQKLLKLTRKERSVVDMVKRYASASNREIAMHLHISENTLRNHLTSVYSKLGLSSRMQLYAFLTNNDK